MGHVYLYTYIGQYRPVIILLTLYFILQNAHLPHFVRFCSEWDTTLPPPEGIKWAKFEEFPPLWYIYPPKYTLQTIIHGSRQGAALPARRAAVHSRRYLRGGTLIELQHTKAYTIRYTIPVTKIAHRNIPVKKRAHRNTLGIPVTFYAHRNTFE